MSEKHEEVFSGIRSEIQTINSGGELFYGEDYVKIGVNTEDNEPLKKKLKFPSSTIIIRCVFEESGKLYLQIYLDECLYESWRCSKWIDIIVTMIYYYDDDLLWLLLWLTWSC